MSSFGFSGTNAHVVLERAAGAVAGSSPVAVIDPPPLGLRQTPAAPEMAPGWDPRPVHLLPLSARDPAALDTLVSAWSARLAEPDADYAALCHTAGAGRARFAHRVAVVAPDAASARAALASATAATAGKPRVAFLCTGQGSTYAGMAAGLADTAPVFRAVLQRCDAVMGLDRPLAALFTDAAALARTDYAQPALYAVSAGLGALWRSWGIEPVAVLGHSVGEYAAAHLAGVLTLEDGARLIATRGRLMQALPAGGAMAALLGPAAAARALLARHAAIEVAGINSATALTVAGAEADDRPPAGRPGAAWRRVAGAEAGAAARVPLAAAGADAGRAGGGGGCGAASGAGVAGGGEPGRVGGGAARRGRIGGRMRARRCGLRRDWRRWGRWDARICWSLGRNRC